MKKNKLIVISGPSGAGEDSVIKGLVRRGLPIERVITTVTRSIRHGEAQGRPYYFISALEFRKMIERNEFVEWAVVYGDYRGCTYRELKRVRDSGKIGIWKMDTQGAITAKKKVENVVSIYIKPPSLKVAVARIKRRGRDTEKEIEQRKKYIIEYLKPENDKKFDYVVVNKEGKLDETIEAVLKIIK